MITNANNPNPTIMEFFEAIYCLDNNIKTSTKKTMNTSLTQFVEYLESIERPDTVQQIEAVDLSRWVQALEASRVGSDPMYRPRTIKSKRADIITVLRYAASQGYCGKLGKVRSIRVPQPTPQAWTLDELSRLIDAARDLPGYMSDGTNRSLYWETIIAATYDTGLRKADVFNLTASQIDKSGRIWVAMEKTGDTVCRQLRPHTITLIEQLAVERDRDDVFFIPGVNGGQGCDCQLRYWWDKLKNLARVRSKGQFHGLRRTGATHLEKEKPGHAKAYLGHRTAGMEKHYVDLRIAGASPPLPPTTPAMQNIKCEEPEITVPLLSELVDSYLATMTYTTTYQQLIRRTARKFIEFYGGDPRIDRIHDGQIRRWVATLDCPPKLATNYSIVLRTLVRHAVEQKLRGPLVVKKQT